MDIQAMEHEKSPFKSNEDVTNDCSVALRGRTLSSTSLENIKSDHDRVGSYRRNSTTMNGTTTSQQRKYRRRCSDIVRASMENAINGIQVTTPSAQAQQNDDPPSSLPNREEREKSSSERRGRSSSRSATEKFPNSRDLSPLVSRKTKLKHHQPSRQTEQSSSSSGHKRSLRRALLQRQRSLSKGSFHSTSHVQDSSGRGSRETSPSARGRSSSRTRGRTDKPSSYSSRERSSSASRRLRQQRPKKEMPSPTPNRRSRQKHLSRKPGIQRQESFSVTASSSVLEVTLSSNGEPREISPMRPNSRSSSCHSRDPEKPSSYSSRNSVSSSPSMRKSQAEREKRQRQDEQASTASGQPRRRASGSSDQKRLGGSSGSRRALQRQRSFTRSGSNNPGRGRRKKSSVSLDLERCREMFRENANTATSNESKTSNSEAQMETSTPPEPITTTSARRRKKGTTKKMIRLVKVKKSSTLDSDNNGGEGRKAAARIVLVPLSVKMEQEQQKQQEQKINQQQTQNQLPLQHQEEDPVKNEVIVLPMTQIPQTPNPESDQLLDSDPSTNPSHDAEIDAASNQETQQVVAFQLNGNNQDDDDDESVTVSVAFSSCSSSSSAASFDAPLCSSPNAKSEILVSPEGTVSEIARRISASSTQSCPLFNDDEDEEDDMELCKAQQMCFQNSISNHLTATTVTTATETTMEDTVRSEVSSIDGPGFFNVPSQPASTTGIVNLAMWEMRNRFKREFPDDPVPSDLVLRQLYRSDEIAIFEMRERYSLDNPSVSSFPSDEELRKLYNRNPSQNGSARPDRLMSRESQAKTEGGSLGLNLALIDAQSQHSSDPASCSSSSRIMRKELLKGLDSLEEYGLVQGHGSTVIDQSYFEANPTAKYSRHKRLCLNQPLEDVRHEEICGNSNHEQCGIVTGMDASDSSIDLKCVVEQHLDVRFDETTKKSSEDQVDVEDHCGVGFKQRSHDVTTEQGESSRVSSRNTWKEDPFTPSEVPPESVNASDISATEMFENALKDTAWDTTYHSEVPFGSNCDDLDESNASFEEDLNDAAWAKSHDSHPTPGVKSSAKGKIRVPATKIQAMPLHRSSSGKSAQLAGSDSDSMSISTHDTARVRESFHESIISFEMDDESFLQKGIDARQPQRSNCATVMESCNESLSIDLNVADRQDENGKQSIARSEVQAHNHVESGKSITDLRSTSSPELKESLNQTTGTLGLSERQLNRSVSSELESFLQRETEDSHADEDFNDHLESWSCFGDFNDDRLCRSERLHRNTIELQDFASTCEPSPKKAMKDITAPKISSEGSVGPLPRPSRKVTVGESIANLLDGSERSKVEENACCSDKLRESDAPKQGAIENEAATTDKIIPNYVGDCKTKSAKVASSEKRQSEINSAQTANGDETKVHDPASLSSQKNTLAKVPMAKVPVASGSVPIFSSPPASAIGRKKIMTPINSVRMVPTTPSTRLRAQHVTALAAQQPSCTNTSTPLGNSLRKFPVLPTTTATATLPAQTAPTTTTATSKSSAVRRTKAVFSAGFVATKLQSMAQSKTLIEGTPTPKTNAGTVLKDQGEAPHSAKNCLSKFLHSGYHDATRDQATGDETRNQGILAPPPPPDSDWMGGVSPVIEVGCHPELSPLTIASRKHFHPMIARRFEK